MPSPSLSLSPTLSRSADVVAMVLAPLFSEKGHPTGLSLAASLSSLPPPYTHPSPHIAVSLPSSFNTTHNKLNGVWERVGEREEEKVCVV